MHIWGHPWNDNLQILLLTEWTPTTVCLQTTLAVDDNLAHAHTHHPEHVVRRASSSAFHRQRRRLREHASDYYSSVPVSLHLSLIS